jgi:hypothetical protein
MAWLQYRDYKCKNPKLNSVISCRNGTNRRQLTAWISNILEPIVRTAKISPTGLFLSLPLERMIGSRMNWTRFTSIKVLCMNNLTRPQQMTLSDTRYKHARHCHTVRQVHFIIGPVAPSITRLDISKFLYFGPSEDETAHEQTSHSGNLERQPTVNGWNWELCSMANGGHHVTSCSGGFSGGWRAFELFHVKSFSSSWIRVCVNSVSFHSEQALRNYRPQRPGRFI